MGFQVTPDNIVYLMLTSCDKQGIDWLREQDQQNWQAALAEYPTPPKGTLDCC